MNTHTRVSFLKTIMGHVIEPVSPPAEVTDSMVSKKGLTIYKGEWGEKQRLHLLRRCLFGVKPEEVKHFSTLTVKQCVDELLEPAALPEPPINAYNSGDIKDPDIPMGKTWISAPYGPLPPGLTAAQRMGVIDSMRRESLKAWWAGLMVNQTHCISQKMVLFWHTAMSTQMKQVMDARYSYRHLALFHKYALGNFKHLVREITTDPQMLVYLNGNTNTAAEPNENYARELQELFTVGKEHGMQFTEDDVRAAARVLTGWTDNFTSPESTNISSSFRPGEHDSTDKKFSAFYNNTVIKGRPGADGAKETDELIDMVFKTSETAKTLCRRLYRFFVYYYIDEAVEKNVITPLSEILITNNFEVVPVLRALLSSEHFYDNNNMGCLIKDPATLIAGAVRQFNMQFADSSDYVKLYKMWIEVAALFQELEMNIGDPPVVAGWPANYQMPHFHELWINSDTLSQRNQITDELLSTNGRVVDDVVLKLDHLKFTKQLSDPGNPDKLIDESVRLLSPVPFDTLQIGFVKKQYLLSGLSDDSYWTAAWNQYMSHPDDPIARNPVETRLQQYYMYLLSRAEYQLT